MVAAMTPLSHSPLADDCNNTSNHRARTRVDRAVISSILAGYSLQNSHPRIGSYGGHCLQIAKQHKQPDGVSLRSCFE